MSIAAEIPFHESFSSDDIKKIVEHFGGTAKKKKGIYWEITFPNVIDFFWLGANLDCNIQTNGITTTAIAHAIAQNFIKTL